MCYCFELLHCTSQKGEDALQNPTLCFIYSSVTNLKYWGRCEPVISRTLQFLNDLSVGYPFHCLWHILFDTKKVNSNNKIFVVSHATFLNQYIKIYSFLFIFFYASFFKGVLISTYLATKEKSCNWLLMVIYPITNLLVVNTIDEFNSIENRSDAVGS